MNATVTVKVVYSEKRKTQNGKEYWVLTLADGSKVKAFCADWGEKPPVELNPKVHIIYQPASFVGAEGKVIHQLPIVRMASNAVKLETLGFSVRRQQPKAE